MERLALTVIFWIPMFVFADQFHIYNMPAGRALNEFSRQSNLQILFDYNVVAAVAVNDLDGEMTPEDALRVMFEDTELTYTFVNERTLAITIGVLSPKIVDSATLAKWLDGFEYVAMSYPYDNNMPTPRTMLELPSGEEVRNGQHGKAGSRHTVRTLDRWTDRTLAAQYETGGWRQTIH